MLSFDILTIILLMRDIKIPGWPGASSSFTPRHIPPLWNDALSQFLFSCWSLRMISRKGKNQESYNARITRDFWLPLRILQSVGD